jgi:hypothetical protein
MNSMCVPLVVWKISKQYLNSHHVFSSMLEVICANTFMMNYLNYCKFPCSCYSLLYIALHKKKCPPYVFMAQHLIKHWDNFTFILVGWAPVTWVDRQLDSFTSGNVWFKETFMSFSFLGGCHHAEMLILAEHPSHCSKHLAGGWCLPTTKDPQFELYSFLESMKWTYLLWVGPTSQDKHPIFLGECALEINLTVLNSAVNLERILTIIWTSINSKFPHDLLLCLDASHFDTL